jgi:cephalosporin-C deacetylase
MLSGLDETGRAFRLRRSENRTAPPPDFDEFWGRTLSALSAVDPEPQLLHMSEINSSLADLVEIRSWGLQKVRCWFSHRREVDEEPRPLLITSHGYGSACDPERARRLSALGFDVVAVDVRGFGLSRAAVPALSPFGYLLTGCDSRETSIMRGALCDFIQAYRAGLSWFGPCSKAAFQGFSFAGALALMATGVLSMQARNWGEFPLPAPPDLLAVGAPSLGHLEKRLQLCRGGSGAELAEYLRQNPLRRHELMRVMSYYDASFFAAHLGDHQSASGRTKPEQTILGVGMDDPIVPAETVYAIYNALHTNYELIELPCSHTDRPEEVDWIKWERAWIRALKAPPQEE